MQWLLLVARFRHWTFVAPHAVALRVHANRNPVFHLLKLGFFLSRTFGAKMHPPFAIARFLLIDLEHRPRGVRAKRIVDESIETAKGLLCGRLLPGFTPIKTRPDFIFDRNHSERISIFRLDSEIEVLTRKQAMHSEPKRAADSCIYFPGSVFHQFQCRSE